MKVHPISDLSYPLDGVTIDQLNEFVDDCGGRSVFDGKTTDDINKEIQKPMTLDKKVSYCFNDDVEDPKYTFIHALVL